MGNLFKRFLGRALGLALAALLAWLGAVLISIQRFAAVADNQPADAAIVLGAAVAQGLPTPVFEERIRHGLALYRGGRVRKLILTGGVGAGDVLAESEAARRYCLAQGVPGTDLLLETVSHSTEENLREAQRLVAQAGLTRVLIVSDPLHLKRALTIARDLGLDAYPSPTPTSRIVGVGARWRFLLRETYFLARYQVMARVGLYNVTHFNRDFRKVYGLSPREYRDRHGQAAGARRAVAPVRYNPAEQWVAYYGSGH